MHAENSDPKSLKTSDVQFVNFSFFVSTIGSVSTIFIQN